MRLILPMGRFAKLPLALCLLLVLGISTDAGLSAGFTSGSEAAQSAGGEGESGGQPGGSASPPGSAGTKALDLPPPTMMPEVSVRLADGVRAHDVAASVGGQVMFAMGSLKGWWLLKFPTVEAAGEATEVLRETPGVLEAHWQRELHRVRKLNDPYFGDQWHLVNTGQSGGVPGMDLRVQPVWDANVTGNGRVIAVIDDGVQGNHPDLAPNYSAAQSFDYLSGTNNASPVGQDSHGTACAGIAAARGDNGIGVAGVAYQSTLVGLRLVGSGQNDAKEGAALSHLPQAVHVYSNSWGPADGGQFEAPMPSALAAFQQGITTGRGGLGNIYVWAAGNGGENDWSNKDGYAGLPETIAVSAVDRNGLPPSYAEGGSNILVAALAGLQNVTTVDLMGAAGDNSGLSTGDYPDGDYTRRFDGTSATTPQVSGVVALMLQANPSLDWRSVQHILVRTSRRINQGLPGWTTNGAGYQFHHRHGAGLIDAEAAVALASIWTGVPGRQTELSGRDEADVVIQDASPTWVSRTLNVASQLYLEHVVVEFAAQHTFWGDFEIELESPSGTISTLAAPSGLQTAHGPGPGSQTHTFNLMSVRHWGEQSQGNWTLRVRDMQALDTGRLVSWRLVLHGTNSAVGTTGGAATPGAPVIGSLSANPVLLSGSVTISGSNLAANPNLSVSIGGVSQTVISSSGTSITLSINAGTPTGSQNLTVNNGVASTSVPITVLASFGGGGGCAMALGGSRGGWWLGVLAVALVGVYLRRRRKLA
jgi:subtilisin family serine protease/subtilisin-like proprotein convertase family protein